MGYAPSALTHPTRCFVMVTIVFPIEIVTPSKRYATVNRCIYCGSDAAPLTDEHIIPLALAGDATILPNASCLVCAEITGKLEGYCLRGMLGNLRITIGAPTRRPKERKPTMQVKTGQFNRANNMV